MDFNIIFRHLCFKPCNLTRLLMTIYFSTISTIESFFNLEMELDSISKLSPMFFNCVPDFTLQINNQTIKECIIELYPTQILAVNSFSEKTHVINLQLLMNSDLHIYYPENKQQLIQVHKLHFEGLYSNLIECQQLNSIQYLSALFSKQLLNQNEFNSEAKIIETNSA